MILQMHHTGFYVKDLDEAVDFYTSLGFTVELSYRSPETSFSFLTNGSSRLELLQSPPNAIPRRAAGVSHVALQVTDARKAFAELQTEGVEMTGPVRVDGPDDTIHFTFKTPDGHYIEMLENPSVGKE